MTNERDVVVRLTWEESSDVLASLRYDTGTKKKAAFEMLKERIGQARLALAEEAAKAGLRKFLKENPKP